MKIRLELVHKKAKVKKVWLKADTIIGRSTECGLRIASNEVSRQHCKISVNDDGVTVRDLGSSNGTFVNGYQLEPDTDYEIAPNSELSLGGIKFFVRFTEPAAKVMQNDGMGSTIDLKPPGNFLPEEVGQVESPAEHSEDDAPRSEPDEPVEASGIETVQMGRPHDGNALASDADYEISTHGDSAILERDDEEKLADLEEMPAQAEEVVDLEPAEPASDDDEEEAVDLEEADEPETKEMPVGTPLPSPEARLLGEDASEDDPTTEASSEGISEEDVASFLNQVADEEPSDDNDEDEPLGDFFKQFD